MIAYILLLMLGLKLGMYPAYFILLGIGAMIKCTCAGIEIYKKAN